MSAFENLIVFGTPGPKTKVSFLLDVWMSLNLEIATNVPNWRQSDRRILRHRVPGSSDKVESPTLRPCGYLLAFSRAPKAARTWELSVSCAFQKCSSWEKGTLTIRTDGSATSVMCVREALLRSGWLTSSCYIVQDGQSS